MIGGNRGSNESNIVNVSSISVLVNLEVVLMGVTVELTIDDGRESLDQSIVDFRPFFE